MTVSYAISVHQEDLVMFELEAVQKQWSSMNHGFWTWQDPDIRPFLPENQHLVVDVIQTKSGGEIMRLLAIYDSDKKKYIIDEDELKSVSMEFSLDFERDRFGNWIGKQEDEGVDYGYRLGQVCPTCKTEHQPMYEEHPGLAKFCECSRGRWDDQIRD